MVWKEDELLLGKRINPESENNWQFPGGHLEFGETVSACAKREVLEETGLHIKNMKQAGYTSDVYTPLQLHYVTLFVLAGYISGEAKVLEPDKCERWAWFRYDELPSPLFLPITSFLKQNPDLKRLRNDLDTRVSEHR